MSQILSILFNQMNEPLLTPSELAEHYSVSLRTVQNWIKSGLVPHEVLPGGTVHKRRRFRVSVVDLMLTSFDSKSGNKYNGGMGLYRYKTGKNKSDLFYYKIRLDGQTIYGATGTSDRKLADEIFLRARMDALEGRKKASGPFLTLGKAVESYLAWSMPPRDKESTYKDKRNRVNTLLAHFGADTRLSTITVATVQDYMNKRKAMKGHNRDSLVSGATINRELSVLQGLFTWAKANGKTLYSPFDSGAIEKFKENPGHGRYLNPNEKQRLIDACNEKFRPIVLTVLNTGMRRGEIHRLQWCDVDFETRTIFLSLTKSRNRTIKMGEGFMAMLQAIPQRSEHVFTHEDGTPISLSWIEKEMPETCKRAGIDDFTFHDMRDVFATDFYKSCRDIRKLQRVLGHGSLASTERYLATLGLEDSTEAEAISDSYFSYHKTVRKTGRIEENGVKFSDKVIPKSPAFH